MPIKPSVSNQETFSTQNLYQGAYLLSCGFKILGTEQEGSKVSITFQGASIKKAAMDFYNGGKVEAKTAFDSYRTIKDMVFQR